jgi:hypothetical protein
MQVLIYAAGAVWLLLSIPARAIAAALRRAELVGAAV